MTAVANVTYVSPDTGAACGLPRGDAWTILREAATSDMPWPGFLLGQTPASIWYWCADQMMVQKNIKNIAGQIMMIMMTRSWSGTGVRTR